MKTTNFPNSNQESKEVSEVYVWGSNSFGQLGLGQKYCGKILQTPKICLFNLCISKISCGENFSAFITSECNVYTMGCNKYGQLGIGDNNILYSHSPVLVEALSLNLITDIACGSFHAVTIDDSYLATSWGSSSHGQTGLGNCESTNVPLPMKLSSKNTVQPKFVNVSAGSRHTALVTDEGKIFLCGDGQMGQLANGKTDAQNCYLITPYIAEPIAKVACGDSHTLFLSKSQCMYSCGRNLKGELGIGNKRNTRVAVKIKELENEKIIEISAGYFSAAVSERGSLYVWGTGIFGEYLVPKKIEAQEVLFEKISAYKLNLAGVDKDGFIWTSGSNEFGQLGTGDFESSSSLNFQKFLDKKKCFNIAIGDSFVMALGTTKQDSQQSLSENNIQNSDISIAGSRNSRSGSNRNEINQKQISELEKDNENLIQYANNAKLRIAELQQEMVQNKKLAKKYKDLKYKYNLLKEKERDFDKKNQDQCFQMQQIIDCLEKEKKIDETEFKRISQELGVKEDYIDKLHKTIEVLQNKLNFRDGDAKEFLKMANELEKHKAENHKIEASCTMYLKQ